MWYEVSFFCMWISSPGLICWRDYSSPIELSWHSSWKSIDHTCMGLCLDTQFYSINLHVYFNASSTLFFISVIINFMSTSLGMAMKLFLKESSIWICGLSKADGPLQCGYYPILRGPEQNKKAVASRTCPPSTCGPDLRHRSSLALHTPGTHTSRLVLELTSLALWLWGLRKTLPAFLGIQLADSSSWDFSVSIIAWANTLQ